MASAKDVVGKIVMVVVLGAAGLSVYNVTADNTAVVKAARLAMACPSEAECQLSRYDRRPWEQRFELFSRGQGKVVRCAPEYLLLGAYKCRVTDERAAPPAVVR